MLILSDAKSEELRSDENFIVVGDYKHKSVVSMWARAERLVAIDSGKIDYIVKLFMEIKLFALCLVLPNLSSLI